MKKEINFLKFIIILLIIVIILQLFQQKRRLTILSNVNFLSESLYYGVASPKSRRFLPVTFTIFSILFLYIITSYCIVIFHFFSFKAYSSVWITNDEKLTFYFLLIRSISYTIDSGIRIHFF